MALKLLRVTNTGRDGFILKDFPRIVQEAELLEEYRGGMNSFVHSFESKSFLLVQVASCVQRQNHHVTFVAAFSGMTKFRLTATHST